MLKSPDISPFLAQQAPTSLHELWFRSKPGAVYASDVDALFMWVFWFCVICFVFLMGVMVYWTVKYRRVPGKKLQLSSSHNTPLEIIWTVGPLIPLAYIFFAGFHGYVNGLVAPGDSMEIVVKASKWNWDLQYPNGGTSVESTYSSKAPQVVWTDANTGKKTNVERFGDATETLRTTDVPIFYVPAEKNVRLRMSSADVLHAFWIPDFRIKQDVLPNRYTSLWFRTPPLPDDAEKLPNGVPYVDHWIFCAEYCGDSHSEMMGIFRVVPAAYFDKWVELAASGGTPEEQGFKLYKRNCASCHSVDGSPNTGPTWKPDPGKGTGWGSSISLDKGSPNPVVFDENYARESILDPQAKIHVTYGTTSAMNSFAGQLKDEQIENIIAYMKSLKK